jgi:DNA-directed RNA polymerase subunit RPC12/RpoP
MPETLSYICQQCEQRLLRADTERVWCPNPSCDWEVPPHA